MKPCEEQFNVWEHVLMIKPQSYGYTTRLSAAIMRASSLHATSCCQVSKESAVVASRHARKKLRLGIKKAAKGCVYHICIIFHGGRVVYSPN